MRLGLTPTEISPVNFAATGRRRFAEDYGEPERDFLTVPFRRELAALT